MRPVVFGLDISDRSVELAALLTRKGRVMLTHVGRIELAPGIVTQGAVADADRLVAALAALMRSAFGAKHGRLDAGVALPELLTYSKTFTLPSALAPDLATKAIALEAQDVFPISMPNTVHGLLTLSRQGEQQEVFYAAVERQAVRTYSDVLMRAGVRPLFLDIESLALARALVDPAEQEPVLIADIGARTTLLAVHERGAVRFSSNVMAGGDALNAAIEHRLNVSLSQSETLRRKAGFDPAVEDGRLFLIMSRPMGEIIEDMRRTVEYYAKKTGQRIRKIVLAGGTSLTPGIRDYVASNFSDMEVVAGDPLKGVDVSLVPQSEAFQRSGVVFSAAIGLALRAIGVRGDPGMNLMPDQRQRRSGLTGVIGNAFATIISMVTRKKPQPKKRTSKAVRPTPPVKPSSAGPMPEEMPKPSPEPVRMQIDVKKEPAPAPAPNPAVEMPKIEPPPAKPVEKVLPAATALDIMGGFSVPAMEPPSELAAASKAAAMKAASESATEDLDYGHGIGDILGSVDEIDASKAHVEDGASIGPDDGKEASRRSIESILSGEASFETQKPLPPPLLRRPKPPRFVGGPSRIPWMLILALILFIAAAGGIVMFVKKNGMPKPPAFLVSMFKKKEQPPAPTPEPAVAQPSDAPATVSVVVKLAAGAKTEGDKPVLGTRIIETDVSAKDSFPATGETTSAAGRATGFATIINTTSRPYTFVATTRLLSKEGILFRMKSAANIPANGSVKVEVYADQPGSSGDIGPTTFTIPGLSPSLQKEITAKSDASMTGGGGKAKAVTADDLAMAKAVLIEKLKKESQANFGVMLAEGEKLHADLVTSTEISVDAPKAGTAGTTFTMTLKLRFRAMLIPEKALLPMLEKAMSDALPQGVNAADYALGAPLYTVQAYDTAAEQAEVRVEATVLVAK